MTDRIKGFVVTLDEDCRDDDVEALAQSIRQLRGVADVSPSVANPSDFMNRERVRRELEQKLWEALRPKGEA